MYECMYVHPSLDLPLPYLYVHLRCLQQVLMLQVRRLELCGDLLLWIGDVHNEQLVTSIKVE